ncbi:hypothetical protein D3C87_527430 [compost metagenome]
MKETQIHIRPAIPSEHGSLEDLQLRASLANPGDREAIQSAPDAVDLPLAQIIDNRVFVAEVNAAIAGFAVVLPNDDASAELDGLFVDPDMWRHGIGGRWSTTVSIPPGVKVCRYSTSQGIPTLVRSIFGAGLNRAMRSECDWVQPDGFARSSSVGFAVA